MLDEYAPSFCKSFGRYAAEEKIDPALPLDTAGYDLGVHGLSMSCTLNEAITFWIGDRHVGALQEELSMAQARELYDSMNSSIGDSIQTLVADSVEEAPTLKGPRRRASL